MANMASKPKAFMVRTGVVQQTNRWVSCAHEFQVNMYKFWGFIICDVCDFLFNCKNCFSDSSEVYNQKGKFLPSSSFCFPWCFLSSLLFRFFPLGVLFSIFGEYSKAYVDFMAPFCSQCIIHIFA